MQNQWKLLSQLRDYLNKTNYDRNQHVNFSKDWLDTLQKLTYSQLDTIRKLSSVKTTDADKSSDTKYKSNRDSKNERVIFVSDETEQLVDNSTTIRPKVQQVIT